MSVLKYMLLTFQHSHEAFHLVRALCAALKRGGLPSPTCLAGVRTCCLYWGWGFEAQDLEVLDVRTGGDLKLHFTDRRLRPEDGYGFPIGPQ